MPQHARFHHHEQLTPYIASFWFKPERPLDQIAGQYLELTLQHPKPDSRGVRRWFTISSRPGSELFSITTRQAVSQSSSFKHYLFHKLTVGDTVHISDPLGDFVLPRSTNIPLICIAGGIGITPFMSIFSWLANQREQRHITLLHAVRDASESTKHFIHPTMLDQLDKHLPIKGALTGTVVRSKLGSQPSNALYYISGPEAMTQALAADLQAHGIDRQQIVTDDFLGYDTPASN